MFAVPGWSVSASALKTQITDAPKAAPNHAGSITNDEVDAAERTHKKRKRSSGKSKEKDVNGNNLADLWENIIEGKTKEKKSKERGGKRVKVEKDAAVEGSDVKEDGKTRPETTEVIDKRIITHASGIKSGKGGSGKKSEKSQNIQDEDEDTAPTEKKQGKSKTLKEKKREKKAALQQPADAPASTITPTKPKDPIKAATKPTTTPKAIPQLTPLQASMRQKLISARFRHLNQTLYTTPSAHSLTLFQDNPEMFTEYHEGFRRQVEVWPENPVDSYISTVKSRGKVRGPQRGKSFTS